MVTEVEASSFFKLFGCTAGRMLASGPGVEPTPPAGEVWSLTVVSPGKSNHCSLKARTVLQFGLMFWREQYPDHSGTFIFVLETMLVTINENDKLLKSTPRLAHLKGACRGVSAHPTFL